MEAETIRSKPATFRSDTEYKYGLQRKDGHDCWEDLLKPLQANDNAQCEVWKDEVQNVLIFASLFSAVVTAFIIESYKDLKPDPNDAAVILLARIATRLDSLTNSTADSSPNFDDFSFSLAPSTVRVNVLWILSLITSLTTVLIGIVSSQWLREHQRYPEHFSSEERFGLLNMRMEMVKRWKVYMFFACLPVLLQLALILFFLGLAEFLHSLQVQQVTIPIIIAISLSLSFLLLTTVIPALQVFTVMSKRTQGNINVPVPCPYKSPQSRLFGVGLTSKIGILFAWYIFLPPYSLLVQSLKRIRLVILASVRRSKAVSVRSRYVQWVKFAALELFMSSKVVLEAAIITSKELFPLTKGHSTTGIPRDDPPFQPHYANLKPLHARSWMELDLEWISIRRNYSFQVFTGSEDVPNDGGLVKELGYGPCYDNLRGIHQVCRRYKHNRTILESAYQCFVDCITTNNMRPGNPSSDRSFLHYGDRYYRAIGKMLLADPITHTKIQLLPRSKALHGDYDEVVLLFVRTMLPPRLLPHTEIELLFRTCTSLCSDAPTIRMSTDEIQKRVKCLWHLGIVFGYYPLTVAKYKGMHLLLNEYLESIFLGLLDDRTDWVVHRLLAPGPTQLIYSIGHRYLPFHDVSPDVLSKVTTNLESHWEMESAAFNKYHPRQFRIKYLSVHSFLTAFVLVCGAGVTQESLGPVRGPVQPGFARLAAALNTIYRMLLAPDKSEWVEEVLRVIGIVWALDGEAVQDTLELWVPYAREDQFQPPSPVITDIEAPSERAGAAKTQDRIDSLTNEIIQLLPKQDE